MGRSVKNYNLPEHLSQDFGIVVDVVDVVVVVVVVVVAAAAVAAAAVVVVAAAVAAAAAVAVAVAVDSDAHVRVDMRLGKTLDDSSGDVREYTFSWKRQRDVMLCSCRVCCRSIRKLSSARLRSFCVYKPS